MVLSDRVFLLVDRDNGGVIEASRHVRDRAIRCLHQHVADRLELRRRRSERLTRQTEDFLTQRGEEVLIDGLSAQDIRLHFGELALSRGQSVHHGHAGAFA
ncbi:hypothetical protein D9M69_661290 [compost metagenome]